MDFKPENIIVMPQNGHFSLKFLQLKLVDFADSIKVKEPKKDQPQTQESPTTCWEYVGPEIYLAERIQVEKKKYEVSQ
jgi:hypothetical protein